VAEREPVAEALDADGDQADAGPGVEPGVPQPQIGRVRGQPEKVESGAEDRQATVVQCRFSARVLAQREIEQSEHRDEATTLSPTARIRHGKVLCADDQCTR
jgi:hypothetical protein